MLLQQLTEINERLAAKGFETEPIIIEPPATEEELRAMEETLGVALPPP
jgi:cell wall assembly regulator SMI1